MPGTSTTSRTWRGTRATSLSAATSGTGRSCAVSTKGSRASSISPPRPTWPAPSSTYSASKAGADRLAYAYHVTYGLPVIILRPSNNFGPHQYPEKFIPLFATRAIEGQPLPLYGKGTNVRDWLYVEDCCRAVEFLMGRGKSGEVYNIGAR